MKYVYAAMLLHSLDRPITENNIIQMMRAVGVDPDLNQIKSLVKTLEGVDIRQTLKDSMKVAKGHPELIATKEPPVLDPPKEEKKKTADDVGLDSLFGNF